MSKAKEKHKQHHHSVYMPAEMLLELWAEAERQDCSVSKIVQRAWRLAKRRMRRFGERSDRARRAPIND